MNPGLFKRGRKRLLELFLRKALGLGSPERIAAFAARRYGKRIFLVQVEGDIELSFEDLVRKSRQTAEALGYRGLAAGEVLAFCARNSIEYFIYRLACHRLGLAFMALPESLDDAAASSCVAAVGARAYYSKGVLELLPAGRSPSLSDVSTLNVSSGTTGATPKIVGLSSRNWVESLYGYVGASEEKLDRNYGIPLHSSLRDRRVHDLPALAARRHHSDRRRGESRARPSRGLYRALRGESALSHAHAPIRACRMVLGEGQAPGFA